MRRGFGKRDTDDVDASAMFQRVTARLHAVIIEVGIKHRVAGTQPVVAGDQRLERLGRIAREGDFLGRDAELRRDTGAHGEQIGKQPAASIIAGRAIDPPDGGLILRQHRPRHHPPIAILELDDVFDHVILRGNTRPMTFVIGPRTGRQRRSFELPRHRHRRGRHQYLPAVQLHSLFLRVRR